MSQWKQSDALRCNDEAKWCPRDAFVERSCSSGGVPGVIKGDLPPPRPHPSRKLVIMVVPVVALLAEQLLPSMSRHRSVTPRLPMHRPITATRTLNPPTCLKHSSLAISGPTSTIAAYSAFMSLLPLLSGHHFRFALTRREYPKPVASRTSAVRRSKRSKAK
jgi:hypothetical protein